MDRLKPLDALFVDAEDKDPHTSMAIASIAVFDGPPPSHEEFLAYLAGRLSSFPATAGSFARCRSASGDRSGLTTRTSILVITSGGPPCRSPERISNSPT